MKTISARTHQAQNLPTLGQQIDDLAPFLAPLLFIILLLITLKISLVAGIVLAFVGIIAGGFIAWRVAFGL